MKYTVTIRSVAVVEANDAALATSRAKDMLAYGHSDYSSVNVSVTRVHEDPFASRIVGPAAEQETAS